MARLRGKLALTEDAAMAPDARVRSERLIDQNGDVERICACCVHRAAFPVFIPFPALYEMDPREQAWFLAAEQRHADAESLTWDSR